MRLELSRYVEDDLDAIADFIAQDNPSRAVTFIQDIRKKFADIELTHYLLPANEHSFRRNNLRCSVDHRRNAANISQLHGRHAFCF